MPLAELLEPGECGSSIAAAALRQREEQQRHRVIGRRFQDLARLLGGERRSHGQESRRMLKRDLQRAQGR